MVEEKINKKDCNTKKTVTVVPKQRKKCSASISDSENEHHVKHYPEKGGNKQLMLDIQSKCNDNLLSATPKDGVIYLKEIGNNGILQNCTQ